MGEPHRCAVRTGDDLHIHPVLAMLLRVVRLVRADPVGRDQGAVDDHEVAFAEACQGLAQTRCPRRQYVQRFVDVPPGRCLRHSEPGPDLCERLILPQKREREQGLLETAQLPPPRPQFTPSGVSSQETYSTSSYGTSSMAGYGTNEAPGVDVMSGITTPATGTSPCHPNLP
jgi:hypothetical protein